MSLHSFTGTLLVSPDDGSLFLRSSSTNGVSITASSNNDGALNNNKTLATTVEEVPDSPDIATADTAAKGAKKVSPGQQKLPFGKATKKPVKRQSKLATKKSTIQNDARKRSQESLVMQDEKVDAKLSSQTATKRTKLTDISNRNSPSDATEKDTRNDTAVAATLTVDNKDMFQCEQPTQDELGHLSMPDLSQPMDSDNNKTTGS